MGREDYLSLQFLNRMPLAAGGGAKAVVSSPRNQNFGAHLREEFRPVYEEMRKRFQKPKAKPAEPKKP